jgi:hypothetical protein
MDPLFDEKLISIVSRSCAEHITKSLRISAEREAYGPSRNEGLCYESCHSIGFEGDFSGRLYFAFDGYTRMKIIARMAERYREAVERENDVNAFFLEFAQELTKEILEEASDAGFEAHTTVPETLNHRLVPFDLTKMREYILIYFLRDRRTHEYLGRFYVILLVNKY